MDKTFALQGQGYGDTNKVFYECSACGERNECSSDFANMRQYLCPNCDSRVEKFFRVKISCRNCLFSDFSVERNAAGEFKIIAEFVVTNAADVLRFLELDKLPARLDFVVSERINDQKI